LLGSFGSAVILVSLWLNGYESLRLPTQPAPDAWESARLRRLLQARSFIHISILIHARQAQVRQTVRPLSCKQAHLIKLVVTGMCSMGENKPKSNAMESGVILIVSSIFPARSSLRQTKSLSKHGRGLTQRALDGRDSAAF